MKCQIRLLTSDDIAAALLLCRQAGWNQLQSDWIRLIRYQPDGCFAAEVDGKLVGTVTTTSFATDLAWIGMMLVDNDYRRQGIAAELMHASIDYLQGCGVRCIKLDATPLGQAVYARLGFKAELTYQRWQGSVKRTTHARHADLLAEHHYRIDQQAWGWNRQKLLSAFAADSNAVATEAGYGLVRDGFLATYMGPVVASNRQAAETIVATSLGQTEGEVFWDILDANQHAVSLAQSYGFRPVRQLARMHLDAACPLSQPEMQYAIADPAVG